VRPAKASRLLDVVSDVCNLQAQVMSCAELAAGVRTDRLDPSAVSDGLWKHRTLVKTWTQRGTLHVVTAADFPIYASALSANTRFHNASWLKYFGFEAADIHALIDAAANALDGRQLTREQLTAEIVRRARRPHLREHQELVWRKAAWVSAVVVVDGEIAGVWEVKKKKDIEIRPFAPLSVEVRAAVEAEADRLAPFLGEGIRVAVLPAR
jgi:hypothetical protein